MKTKKNGSAVVSTAGSRVSREPLGVARETRSTATGTVALPEQIIHLPLTDIAPDPEQPRKAFPAAELEELAASIRAIGVQQPIVVKKNPRYELMEPDLTNDTWRLREIGQPQPEPVRVNDDPAGHRWEKTDLFSGADTNYRCKNCDCKGVRHGVAWPPSTKAKKCAVVEWPNVFYKEQEGLARQMLAMQNSGPAYTLIFGERRWRASQLAGKETIPAIVRSQTAATARDIFDAQIVENEARADLSLAEKGAAYARAIEQGFHTIGSLMTLTGLKHSAIYNRLALVKAAPAVQEAVNEGKLAPSIAVFLTRIPGHKLQTKALEEILVGGGHEIHAPYARKCMSAREAEEFIGTKYSLQLSEAKFDPKEVYPMALTKSEAGLGWNEGPCTECPMRSGNNRELYADVKDEQICMNPDCFKHKTDVWRERELAKAREDGAIVLTAKESKPLFSSRYWQGHSSGLMPANQTLQAGRDPKNRTAGDLAKALGQDAPRRTVAVDGTGDVVTLYRESEVYEACVKANLIKEPKRYAKSAEALPQQRPTEETPEQKAERERQRRIDEETETRMALAVVEKIEGIKSAKGEAEFLRWLIIWTNEYQDLPWHVIADRRGLARDSLPKMLAGMELPQLRGYLAELHLIDYAGVSAHGLEHAQTFWTVDRKAIEKAVRKELKGSAVVSTAVDGVPPDTSKAVTRDASPSEPEARAPRKKKTKPSPRARSKKGKKK